MTMTHKELLSLHARLIQKSADQADEIQYLRWRLEQDEKKQARLSLLRANGYRKDLGITN